MRPEQAELAFAECAEDFEAQVAAWIARAAESGMTGSNAAGKTRGSDGVFGDGVDERGSKSGRAGKKTRERIN